MKVYYLKIAEICILRQFIGESKMIMFELGPPLTWAKTGTSFTQAGDLNNKMKPFIKVLNASVFIYILSRRDGSVLGACGIISKFYATVRAMIFPTRLRCFSAVNPGGKPKFHVNSPIWVAASPHYLLAYLQRQLLALAHLTQGRLLN